MEANNALKLLPRAVQSARGSEGLPCPVPERLRQGRGFPRTKPSLLGAAGLPTAVPTAPSPSEGSGDRLAMRGLEGDTGPFSSVRGCDTLGTVTLFLPLFLQRILLTWHLRVPCVGTGLPGAALKQGVHPWGPLLDVPAQPRPLWPVMKLPE